MTEGGPCPPEGGGGGGGGAGSGGVVLSTPFWAQLLCVWSSGKAGKVGDICSIPRFCFPFSSEVAVCEYRLVTLPFTAIETLQWPTPLPIVLQKIMQW